MDGESGQRLLHGGLTAEYWLPWPLYDESMKSVAVGHRCSVDISTKWSLVMTNVSIQPMSTGQLRDMGATSHIGSTLREKPRGITPTVGSPTH